MKIVVILLLLCLSVGCVNVRPRSAAWPSDKPLSTASDIQGTFYDADGGLRAALFPRRFTEVTSLADCTITMFPNEKIEFRFTGSDGRSERQLWSYDLIEGWLVASLREGINQEGVLAVKSVALYMRIDVEGSLVVRMLERNVGMLFFIPAVTKDERWYRLPKRPNKSPEPMARLRPAAAHRNVGRR